MDTTCQLLFLRRPHPLNKGARMWPGDPGTKDPGVVAYSVCLSFALKPIL